MGTLMPGSSYTVQRAGGWKSQVMVQRYAHLSPDHTRAAVERLAPVERATQQEIPDQNRDWKIAGLGVIPAKSLTGHGDPGGIRTRDLDLETVEQPTGAAPSVERPAGDAPERVTKSVSGIDAPTPADEEPSQ